MAIKKEKGTFSKRPTKYVTSLIKITKKVFLTLFKLLSFPFSCYGEADYVDHYFFLFFTRVIPSICKPSRRVVSPIVYWSKHVKFR